MKGVEKMTIKTYVINLKNAVDRRQNVLGELSKHPFMNYELVEAVDGREMSQEDVDHLFDCKRFSLRFGREVFPGEIGCTLSHRECYRKLLSSEEEVALILEDDVRFLAEENRVEELIRTISAQMTGIPRVITLTRHHLYYSWGERPVVGEYSLCRVREAWGTCAYLVNRKAAAVLLKIGKPYFVADDFLMMNGKGIRVEGIYPMLAIGASEMQEIPSQVCNGLKVEDYSHLPLSLKLNRYVSDRLLKILRKVTILRKRIYGNKLFDV
ncbi:glycosyltransferase family 25 protein [Parabacteroides gordonii]|uniref:glycosyltransferase family 25 protein n=1 Tax=Parabacteroides gordonii TaxID=574930 RepID=UPI0026F10E22|nr:glycosyltransferase family 25 protein [Parabacteroides gordonii]